MLEEGEPGYVPVDREFEIALAVDALNSGGYHVGLMLVGPTGTGKTLFVRELAYLLGRPLVRVLGSRELSLRDLIGGWELRQGKSVWTKGALPRAMEEGAIFYFDELAESRPDVQAVIHSVADSGILHVPRTGAVYAPREGFLLVASYNPVGKYYMEPRIRSSTLQRFVGIPFRRRYLEGVLRRRLGGGIRVALPRRIADRGDPTEHLSSYLAVAREMEKANIPKGHEPPSMRAIETAARMYSELSSLGLGREEAYELAFLSACLWPMSIDEEEEKAVRALLRLHLSEVQG
ncbi:MAG: AAA family ATPase [Thermoplasmata archaeon]|nr:AAA family ATPase [Thermoplasmata archaeon]